MRLSPAGVIITRWVSQIVELALDDLAQCLISVLAFLRRCNIVIELIDDSQYRFVQRYQTYSFTRLVFSWQRWIMLQRLPPAIG